MHRCYSGALLKLNINEHFRESMAEAFTSFFSTCQKSGLKPGPIWPAPFNGWEEITNICIFDFRCALGALDNDRRIMGLNRFGIERPDPSNKVDWTWCTPKSVPELYPCMKNVPPPFLTLFSPMRIVVLSNTSSPYGASRCRVAKRPCFSAVLRALW